MRESETVRTTDPAWSRRLLNMIDDAVHAPIIGVDEPISQPAAKRELHRATGAAAVDMESHIMARVAAAHRLAFAAVRVIVDGPWGFAASVDLTPEAARDAARHAVEVAKVSAAMNTERIELAPEPSYGDVTWVSAYETDPFAVAARDKVELLAAW